MTTAVRRLARLLAISAVVGVSATTMAGAATASPPDFSASSPLSAVSVKKFSKAPTPTVSGPMEVGKKLTAKTGTWSPAAKFTYQWKRDGKAISGATSSTYTLKPQDAFASITVTVTGKRSGYAAASKTSAKATARGLAYANCTAMKKHYPHGVSRSKTVVDMKNGRPGGPITSTTFVSSALYDLNAKSDRDKDGWACEP